MKEPRSSISLRREQIWSGIVTDLDLVPVLAGEGIKGLLLETFLALREALVPKTP